MTTYTPEQNHIFNVFFTTRLTSAVKDVRAASNEQERIKYTTAQANLRYQEIKKKQIDMPFFFTTSNSEFEFNNYASGGFHINTLKPEAGPYPLVRNFNSKAFKIKFGGPTTQSYTTNNSITVPLNYEIPRIGYNFLETQNDKRQKIKKKLDDLLNEGVIDSQGYPSNRALFDRIVKIMTFMLARERGTTPGQDSSEELMQREYGIICWAIVNAALKGRFQCQKNILKLLQSPYSNSSENVDKKNNTNNVDIQSENSVMAAKYATNVKSNINLQLFVMAFWDGYINEELAGVTNWDHITSYSAGKFVFREMHLPSSFKGQPDPDAGQQITLKVRKEVKQPDKSIKIVEATLDPTAIAGPEFNINNTSNSFTYSLDGNVLFTIQ